MPKVSVLIPLYNRRHYIEQCLNSALNQTFQDYDIIICDDGSTDGSADFVAEKYAAAIAAGKIKLCRNEKNRGEFPTTTRLLREATSKYIMLLHSDDMYLPQAVEQMCTVAEHFNADVVHASRLFYSPPGGVIEKGTVLQLVCWESNPVDEITLMPDDKAFRFNEFITNGTFADAPHCIFRREFLTENGISFDGIITFLFWLMSAKVYVKVPQPFYIYRNSPDSITNENFPPERVTKFIDDQIKLSRRLDEYFAEDEFFKDNEEFRYMVKSHLLQGGHWHWMERNAVYRNGITPELHRAVAEGFKKYFGDDAAFPTFLFHYVHAVLAGQRPDTITPPPQR